MRAAARRGRVRWLIATMAALFLVLPGPVAGEPDPHAVRMAELTRIWAKLQGTPHVHADGSTHRHAADALTVRELAFLGLRHGSGPCLGMFELDGPAAEHRCTHGPDPAPVRATTADATADTTAAINPPPAPAGWTVPSKIPCYSTGPFVEVLWVYQQGQTSRLPQFAEHVRRHVAAMDLMFNVSAKAVIGTNGQPSIRHVKWAHDASCNLKITPASVTNLGDIYSTEVQLYNKGVIKSTSKYIAFLDMDGCGGGVADFMGDESAGQTNAANYGGTYGQVEGCLNLFAPYFDGGAIAAHELMHTLGAVNDGAPHSTSGHCWDDDAASLSGADIMCYDDGYPGAFTRPAACPITSPETFDCRKDDYFNPNPPTGSYLKTHWNTSANKFLSTVEPPSYFTIALATASVPGNGTTIGGFKTITAATTVPPGRSITKVEFKVGSVVVGEDYDAPYSIELDTFQYTNLANVKVTATPYDDLDYPGVASSATYKVANPQVHLDSPTEFSYNSPTLAWAARASGFGGRTIAKVQLTDGYGTPIGPADTTKPYGGTVDFSSFVPDGGMAEVQLGLEVTDSAGVVRETEVRTVFVGASNVYSPFSGDSGFPTEIGAGSQPLEAIVVAPQAPAVSKVEFLVNDVKVGQDTTAPYRVAGWSPAAGTSGELVVRATDAGGHVTESPPSYYTVTASGVNGVITVPADNATISGSNVTVTVTPSIPAGWTASFVSVEDPLGYGYTYLSPVNAGNPDGPWTGTLDTTYMSPGWHILRPRVNAYEDACCGGADVVGDPIFVKVSGPTVAMTAPANGAKVKQVVNVSASVTGGSAYYVQFYAGEYYIGYDDTAPYSVPWDTAEGADGTVRVRAIASMNAGDVAAPARFYSVRNLYAWMGAPTPGQTISGTFLMKGGGRCDRDCHLETATFFVDGVPVNYDRVAPFQYSLNTTLYADGPHTYAITITTNDYRAVSSAIYPMTINN